MKNEVSAGGVVFRKADSDWQVLVVKDMNGQWTFPKGIIQKNEDPITAAMREIGEETGVHVLKYVSDLPIIGYQFKRRQMIQKRVHYYVFVTEGDERLTPQVSEGVSEARWMSKDEALENIGYPETNRELLSQAVEIVSQIP